MKNKKIIIISVIALLSCCLQAQRKDMQQIFVATSEEEVYKLYNQMLDSARLSNQYLIPGMMVERFGFDFFKEINTKDTLMKFVQDCDWKIDGNYECDRFYWSYISNSMPIDFYEHFLNYLKQLDKIENYFIKNNINNSLRPIMDIIINRYESGRLNKEDSIKAKQLIEETLLRIINDRHFYATGTSYDKYMTDKIRQALVNVIENPFYPTEYLDFYISQQDTLCLDTVGISNDIKEKYRKRDYIDYDLEPNSYERLRKFFAYERIGKEEYNGLSPGQAYLQRKKDEFQEKGYLPINYIAEYAYQKQDKLLIKHLIGFKKKHPDYPLKYF